MADPGELFVAMRISHESIADDLNNALGRTEFAPGDERLTGPLCGEYAACYGEAIANCEGGYEEESWVILETAAAFVRGRFVTSPER